jgi:superfamily II DNA or RNA helicase
MERTVELVAAERVRAVIAHKVLGSSVQQAAATPATALGRVVLHPHQQSAVARLRSVLHEYGGALLADDAGLGKTYVAATLAREAAHALIVAPASLRAMWIDALRAANVQAEIVSYTALSRGRYPPGHFDLLVLDEAHHARTPHTRRYARIAELSRSARVLLLSATPIHNARRDLCALCALFLGERGWHMDDHALARCIVRRERYDVAHSARLPRATAPRWLDVGQNDALLHGILALPPPLPPRDGGDGGALLAWSLVRQWASSEGALAGALRRRLARATALGAALESGRHPTRAELAAWSYAEDAVQLAFPELVTTIAPMDATVVDVTVDADAATMDVVELRTLVRAHEHAVRALLRRAREAAAHETSFDAVRAGHLLAIRAAHPGEKVVAFTQYADTVRALYTHLRHAPGVAALTAHGARIAGGVLSRREAIARFAPSAAQVRPPPEAERIDLLLTTDLLSEGVNLQDASVVVHLDLPWTPARLEQRVGRSRRIGARHACTAVYALAPPASAESLLRTEGRLREKLHIAGRAIGIDGTMLARGIGNRVPGEDASAARQLELLYQILAQWADAGAGERGVDDALLVAAVRAERGGMLALVNDEGAPTLIAALGDCAAATADIATVLAAARLARGSDAAVDRCALSRALALAERWLARRDAERAAGGTVSLGARARPRAMQRIAAITARTPRHERPRLAPLIAEARRAAIAPCGIGAERALAELVDTELGDEAWLRALCGFGALYGRVGNPPPANAPEHPRVIAIVVLTRQRDVMPNRCTEPG